MYTQQQRHKHTPNPSTIHNRKRTRLPGRRVAALAPRGGGGLGVAKVVHHVGDSDVAFGWFWGVLCGCVVAWLARRSFLPPIQSNHLSHTQHHHNQNLNNPPHHPIISHTTTTSTTAGVACGPGDPRHGLPQPGGHHPQGARARGGPGKQNRIIGRDKIQIYVLSCVCVCVRCIRGDVPVVRQCVCACILW